MTQRVSWCVKQQRYFNFYPSGEACQTSLNLNNNYKYWNYLRTSFNYLLHSHQLFTRMNEPQTATAQQFFKSPDATSEIEEETDGDGPEIKPAYIKEESTECCNTKPYTNTLKYVITLVIVSFGLVWGWQYIKREFENGVQQNTSYILRQEMGMFIDRLNKINDIPDHQG